MRLNLAQPYLSIRDLEPVSLPPFTILTGENGSGKTHLLRAIDQGNCIVEGVGIQDIAYFDHSSMAPGAPQGATVGQLDQMAKNAFQEFQANWRPRANQLLLQRLNERLTHDVTEQEPGESRKPLTQDELEKLLAGVPRLDGTDNFDKDTKEFVEVYKSVLEDDVLYSSQLEEFHNNSQFSRTVMKTHRPLHRIGSRSFREFFAPAGDEASMYRVSLGFLFSKYKIDEFQWCHDQFETRNKGNIKTLRTTFRRNNPRPWAVINRLLRTIGNYSESDHIFRFKITDPESIELRLSDYNNFSFSPKLINQSSRAECEFTELSSGEKTLLALALAIYGSMDGYKLPRILLLDEIDASLHPSMIVAMIYAIQTAFIEKGVQVILATHSPTTVAIAPEESVFVMGGDHRKKVVTPSAKNTAIEILTEGFVTLEGGLQIREKLGRGVNLLTEGKNLAVLRRFVEIYGIHGVSFIEGLEDRTGKDQLKAYFDLLSILNEHKTLLVFDCDAHGLVQRLQETEKTFVMCLPQQQNSIVTKGIENMFPEATLEPYTKEIHRKGGIAPIIQFDEQRKTEFIDFVSTHGTRKDFRRFRSLRDKIVQIKRLR